MKNDKLLINYGGGAARSSPVSLPKRENNEGYRLLRRTTVSM